MSRETLPLVASDLSAFTRALGAQLKDQDTAPGHLSLMNMVARAAGYRNVQHLRASQAAARRLSEPAPKAPVDNRLVERTLRQFDAAGRLLRWHSKQSVQDLALWALWARIPAEKTMAEREVNDILNTWALFGDPAILRRSMVAQGFMTRKIDGTNYRRETRVPPPDAQALLNHLSNRRRAAPRPGHK